MRKLILAISLMILGAMAHSALQPISALAQAPARGAVAQPQPVMDTASAQAMAPLAIQYQALEARRAQLGADYQAFWTKFHQAEMHALMNATTDGKPTPLDYTRYAVDPNTGTKIVPRQGVPGR